MAALDLDGPVQQCAGARVLARRSKRLTQRGHHLHRQGFIARLLGLLQRSLAVRDGRTRLAQRVIHATQPVPRPCHALHIAVAFGQ
jgi:hypothetical protein